MLGLLNLFMIAVGCIVGVLSGFFGFGGGFIFTPLLISLGFPANISIGTSIMEIFMSSLVNSLRHGFLDNVEVKVGLVAVFASIFGSEFGAQIIEYLENFGTQYMSHVLSLAYTIVLGFISVCMIYDSLKWRNRGKKSLFLWRKFKEIRLPPTITISRPSAEKISVWILVLVGFISGFFAGFLGSGGGFILIPLLIYLVGCKPRVVAGTCAFWVLLNTAYTSLTHFIKGNVDLMLATLIFIGSLIGMQIGITAVKYVKEKIFKFSFGLCLGFISLSTLIRFLSESFDLSFLNPLPPIITFISVLTVTMLIIIALLEERQRIKKVVKIEDMNEK